MKDGTKGLSHRVSAINFLGHSCMVTNNLSKAVVEVTAASEDLSYFSIEALKTIRCFISMIDSEGIYYRYACKHMRPNASLATTY